MLHQFNIEATLKISRKLVDIFSNLKVESTLSFPHREDAILSTLVCLSKSNIDKLSMCNIDGESTKMCQVVW